MKPFSLLVGLLALVYALSPTPPVAAQDEAPEGVTMLLPRGGIPAVFEPSFVWAVNATIDDDAWVLGVALPDGARAYSLNLLNQHEVVNDRLGETHFAAVW